MQSNFFYTRRETKRDEKMKIGIIGDIHLCYRQYGLDERERDFYLRWHQIIDNIINHEDIDFVFQLGDIFDTHIPSSIALHEYEKGIQKLLDNNIKYYSITGNHTIIRKKQNFMSPDDFFNQILDITSLDDASLIINNVFVAGVKYRSESDKEELIQVINQHAEEASNFNGLKILLLHQAIDTDLVYGAELSELDLPINVFDYIFIGHLHSMIQRKHGDCHIIYPGSIERSSTIEAKDAINRGKGFFILDAEMREHEYVKVPFYRDFLFVDFQDLSQIIELKKKIQLMSYKPIVELTFHSIDVDEAYNISEKIAKDCLKLNINVLNDIVEDDDKEKNDEESISSIQNMLRQKLPNEQAIFAYDLLKILNNNGKMSENMASAIELSDEYLRNNYCE